MGKNCAALVCICRILDCVKSSKCDKQYNTWNNLIVSFRPYNHYDCCTRGWNNPSWNWIYGTAEYLDNETADNESVSDKWQCNAHPLKQSGNHSSKLTRAESLKACKWFLMVITLV